MPKLDRRTRDYTEAYSNFYTYVFSAVYSRIGNVDDTKDICQEIFLRFYNKFDEIENHRKWLMGTIRNVMLEFFRRKESKEHASGDMFDDVSLTFVNGFKDTRLIIEDAIENMDNYENESDKILFDLIAVHNYTYAQAGESLGLNKHQIRYRYGIIQNKITDYLKKRGVTSLDDLL